ncbi:hypothetical protein AVEN_120740-1 [Araneus ventricosus]|uniref:Uncharacterized protein n=1 Tax=Araneus ventricosus TaxID=182803 RepID=A0A4Y2D4Y8_ARAVE|nr:hypothetical protein AVEN_120740-1 [Araneus ventricosus]
MVDRRYVLMSFSQKNFILEQQQLLSEPEKKLSAIGLNDNIQNKEKEHQYEREIVFRFSGAFVSIKTFFFSSHFRSDANRTLAPRAINCPASPPCLWPPLKPAVAIDYFNCGKYGFIEQVTFISFKG